MSEKSAPKTSPEVTVENVEVNPDILAFRAKFDEYVAIRENAEKTATKDKNNAGIKAHASKTLAKIVEVIGKIDPDHDVSDLKAKLATTTAKDQDLADLFAKYSD